MAKLFDGTTEWTIALTREEAERIVERDLATNLVAGLADLPTPVAAAFREQIPATTERLHPVVVAGILDGTVRLTPDKRLPHFKELGRSSSYPTEN